MKTFYTLISIIFIWCSGPVSAQTLEMDSVRQVIATTTDSTQLEAMRRMGILFRRVNMDSALHYFNKVQEGAIERGYDIYELRSYNDIGITYGMSSDYPQAMRYLKLLEQKAKARNSTDWLGSAYTNLGIVYKRIGDYPKSLSYYLKDLELNRNQDEPISMANNYTNLGVLYDLMKMPDKAMDYYDQALGIYREFNQEQGISTINQNKGILQLKNQDYENAVASFKRSLAYNRKVDNKIGLCVSLSNLGNTYLGMKELDSARVVLSEARDIVEELRLPQEQSSILYNLAKLEIENGNSAAGLSYAKEMLTFVQDIGSYDLNKDAHEIVYQAFESIGDYKSANFHLEQKMLYNDSLLNETRIKELERQSVVYEVEKKDQELVEQALNLELLNTQVEAETRLRWGLSAFILLLIAFLTLLYLRYTSNKKTSHALRAKNEVITTQNEQIEQMNRELEHRMLRAQINPHFIFNSLSAIQHFITSNEKVSALTYLSKFSNLLRKVLDNSRSPQVLLAEEIQQLTIYIELEALRFDHSFQYEINIAEELDTSKYEMPLLLVQPYIENAILHGLMPKKGDKFFSLSFEEESEYIICTIIDNGVGRKEAAKHTSVKRVSHGMEVTKQRLKGLGRQTRKEASVRIDDLHTDEGQPSGTRVTVNIPKILNE